jgi:hypothetical protein
VSGKSKPFVWDEKAKARLTASLHEAGHFVAAWQLGCAEVSQIIVNAASPFSDDPAL